ncbi:hypothetical protein SAMN04487917_101112 [Arthrobacter sp. yr096]|uniref:hypothetical protein n=1 Tax=unclassified Arthrobacter TaxID=235627 RepID=UPI000899175D|nr:MULTISPECIES: hypothetical protein [unclassified Arthrobacter]SDX39907.1 hypothetical protein SAMN04487912_111113 [Arthrobacter sp. cf158]SEI40749.1 hypothetical protein SAMN04487917_101112 [Arthrobacter sp. yr096]
MAQQADGSRRSPSPTPSANGPSAPPPRPGISLSVPPPITAVVKPPGPARLSRSLWVASFVAGIAVVVTGFLGRDSHFERLKGVIGGMVPDGDAQAVDGATAVVFLGSLTMLALVVVMEAVLLAVLFKRRTWARWALAPVVLLHAVVTVITADFVVAPGADGAMAIVLLAAQFILAAAGLILLFLPSTTTWLLSERRV